MKKYFLIFILLILIGFVYLHKQNASDESTVIVDKKNFVSIKNKNFIKNGEPFYPVTINYIVSMQTDRKDLWPCPTKSYSPFAEKFIGITKKDCEKELYADLYLIKEMGFNSVRIIGIGDEGVADEQTGSLYIRPSIGNEKDTTIILSNGAIYNQYFNALESFLSIMDSVGLKGILLTKVLIDVKSTEEHLKKLVSRFKNNTTLIGYDFFNEPLYFDEKPREKKDVHNAVKRWQSIVKKYSPYHLTTIGLEGIREVFKWDPNILDVDFISLHPYEYEPEQVRNEIFWYGKYIKKPWVIGETAIPADDDSVCYEDQRLFAKKTLEQAYHCGASGYSWWQYKDVNWQMFHADHLGLVNLKGETKTKNGLVVKGTPKETFYVFQSFTTKNNPPQNEQCLCLENYYNYSKGKVCKIKGVLIDQNNNPIEGGVILGWNEHWTKSYHTISKKDGTFELLGDFEFYHWMASATEHSMVRGDFNPKEAPKEKDILTIDIGTLKLYKLDLSR